MNLKTQVDSDTLVSTVTLPFDHNWGGEGGPQLYETLVFGGPLDDEMERYATPDAAEAGHAVMVERCRVAMVMQKGGGHEQPQAPTGGTSSA
jgi:hypothetical protein